MKASHIDLKDDADGLLREAAHDLADLPGAMALVFELRKHRPAGFQMRDKRLTDELNKRRMIMTTDTGPVKVTTTQMDKTRITAEVLGKEVYVVIEMDAEYDGNTVILHDGTYTSIVLNTRKIDAMVAVLQAAHEYAARYEQAKADKEAQP